MVDKRCTGFLWTPSRAGGFSTARIGNVYSARAVNAGTSSTMVALGVPFAESMEDCSTIASSAWAQVSRTFYASWQHRPANFDRGIPGAFSKIGRGAVQMFHRTEILGLWGCGWQCQRHVVENLGTGEITSHAADAVVLATGGTQCFSSPNAKGQRSGHGSLTKRRFLRETPVQADHQRAFTSAASINRANADVRIVAKRRPGLGQNAKRGFSFEAAGVDPGTDREYI